MTSSYHFHQQGNWVLARAASALQEMEYGLMQYVAFPEEIHDLIQANQEVVIHLTITEDA